ncbi:unnamed protein product, partial [Ixodes hexagonus]
VGSQTQTDWLRSLQEVVGKELELSPRMGESHEVVQVDEALFRGRRKANKGRMLDGDTTPGGRHNNYGNRVDGPWVFGLIWEDTKERRMFYVERRDARTLGNHIRQNVAPGTTVVSDKWRGYRCGNTVRDANGPMGLEHLTVNHSRHFVDPVTRANTQLIEQSWKKSKLYLLRKAKGCS